MVSEKSALLSNKFEKCYKLSTLFNDLPLHIRFFLEYFYDRENCV